jgi:hypothetical protein
MAFNNSDNAQVGIGEFVRNAIGLDDNEFKAAMRLDNNDKDIDDIDIPAWKQDEMEAYDRS